jgi:hypothetical protein
LYFGLAHNQAGSPPFLPTIAAVVAADVRKYGKPDSRPENQ